VEQQLEIDDMRVVELVIEVMELYMPPVMKLMNVVLVMKVVELYMIVGMNWMSNEEHIMEVEELGK